MRSSSRRFAALGVPLAVAAACVPSYSFESSPDGGEPLADAGSGADHALMEAAIDGSMMAADAAPEDAADASSPVADAGDAQGSSDAAASDGSSADADAGPSLLGPVALNQHPYHGAASVQWGGQLYSWGDQDSNLFGELGLPVPDGSVSYPVPTTASSQSSAITEISMGENHACSLYGRAAWCRGRNIGGQRGNGSQGDGPQETPVIGVPADGLDAIAASYWATCGITLVPDAGVLSNVYCWGWDGEGETARPYTQTPANQALPVTGEVDGGPTGAITDAVAIGGGGLHHCALTARKTILCWGSTQYLESGPGPGVACPGNYATSCTDQPQEVDLPNAEVPIAIALGERHTCALAETTGNVYCWGVDDANQFGTGSVPASTCNNGSGGTVPCSGAPVQVANLSAMIALRAGGDDTCALDASHHAFCWGANSQSQLGVGDTAAHPTPLEILDGTTSIPFVFDDMRLGTVRACGVMAGALYCWGAVPAGTQVADGAVPYDGMYPAPVVF